MLKNAIDRTARMDWCIACCSSTALVVGIFELARRVNPDPDMEAKLAGLAFCGAFLCSMFTFMIRYFCRVPEESVRLQKPVRNSICASFVGGVAYGVCIFASFSIAFQYLAKPVWNRYPIVEAFSVGGSIVMGSGILAAPIGIAFGIFYSAGRFISRQFRDKPSK